MNQKPLPPGSFKFRREKKRALKKKIKKNAKNREDESVTPKGLPELPKTRRSRKKKRKKKDKKKLPPNPKKKKNSKRNSGSETAGGGISIHLPLEQSEILPTMELPEEVNIEDLEVIENDGVITNLRGRKQSIVAPPPPVPKLKPSFEKLLEKSNKSTDGEEEEEEGEGEETTKKKGMKGQLKKFLKKVKKRSPSTVMKKEKNLSTSEYIRRILKFVSEQKFYIEEIQDEFQRSFYPVRDISKSISLREYIKTRTFKMETTMDFLNSFLENEKVTQSMCQVFEFEIDVEDTYLYFLEIINLPHHSMYLAKLTKDLFIHVELEGMEKFLEKYKEILYKEPTLFCKLCYFLGEKAVEDLTKYEDLPPLGLADSLLLLMKYENAVIREKIGIANLQKCPERFLELIVKPLILLLNPANSKLENQPIIGRFLNDISQKNIDLWSTVNWELILEAENFELTYYKNAVLANNRSKEYAVFLQKQYRLVQKIDELSIDLKNQNEKRRKLIETYKKWLKDVERWRDIFNLGRDYVFLPFSERKIVGFITDECTILKSAKLPLFFTFRTITEDDEDFPALFKTGDDLRLDRLVMTMVKFMDGLLKMHGLDLNIETYNVIGTAENAGFIEIVTECHTLTELENYYGPDCITEYLSEYNETEEEYEEALHRFKNSFAAYCLFSYILGIGDRHLDNLMVKYTGEFFHIDFSFLFGKDPKLGKTKMRVTGDMVNVLNGIGGGEFMEFQIILCRAYNILRYHANSIVFLLYSIIKNEESAEFVLKRFQLDMTEEKANVHILSVLFKSLRSVFPKINEQFHKIAMSLRD